MGFKHLRHHRFNHVVLVNRMFVAMGCLEIDIGKFCETVFGLSFQKGFQCQSFKSTFDRNFIDRDKMIKACDALVT